MINYYSLPVYFVLYLAVVGVVMTVLEFRNIEMKNKK